MLDRLSEEIACRSDARVPCHAGTRPKSTPTINAAAAQKTTTRPSKAIVAAAGSTPGGNERRRDLQDDGADRRAQRAAQRRQHQAFRQQLRDDARSARAERGADRQLASADVAAREQQVRHVGAAQEQHESDDAEQQKRRVLQRRAHHAGAQRLDEDAPALVRLGIRLREPVGDDREIRLRGVEGDTGLEAANDLEKPRGSRQIWRQGQERPDLCRPLQLHLVANDADDRGRLAVETNLTSDQRRIGTETCAPQSLAHHDDGRSALLRIGRPGTFCQPRGVRRARRRSAR